MIYGVGYNDVSDPVSWWDGDKRIQCPIYQTWCGMLRRCYSKTFLEKNSSYRGCQVTTGWHAFSSFKAWMENQEWQDKHLDKDLLGTGKIYGPEHCVFVPQWINNLFVTKGRGGRTGVTPWKDRFQARVTQHGRSVFLGYFPTEAEANAAYRAAKKKHVLSLLRTIKDERLVKAIQQKLETDFV